MINRVLCNRKNVDVNTLLSNFEKKRKRTQKFTNYFQCTHFPFIYPLSLFLGVMWCWWQYIKSIIYSISHFHTPFSSGSSLNWYLYASFEFILWLNYTNLTKPTKFIPSQHLFISQWWNNSQPSFYEFIPQTACVWVIYMHALRIFLVYTTTMRSRLKSHY
jgi:hypothetical protein